MSRFASHQRLRIVVVGGGIAALEAVLALHELAAGHVAVTLIAPEPHFVLRPLAVAAPFSRGRMDDLALERVMEDHGGTFVCDAVRSVDTAARTLTLGSGNVRAYDALVLAHGARELPAFERALTFGQHPEELNGLLADLEQGYTGSVAFVVPDGNSWPLPLYELALMTAQEAWAMNMDGVDLHLVTPEAAPLGLFGTAASAAVTELLAAARITVHCGVHARVTPSGVVELGEGRTLPAERVVALPVLEGRRLEGIDANPLGFIAVDDTGQVVGCPDVYAIGDVTDRRVKQGGLACQQADATAAHLAGRAGAAVEDAPLEQVLRGRLLTGSADRFLRRAPAAEAGTASAEPLWWPPSKVSGKYLTPYLTDLDLVHLPVRGEPSSTGIDVHEPVHGQRRVPGGILAAGPLHPGPPLGVGLRAG